MPADQSSPPPAAVAAPPRGSRRRWPRVPGWLLWIIVPTALHIFYWWSVGWFSLDAPAMRNRVLAGMIVAALESCMAEYPGPLPAALSLEKDTDTSAARGLVTALTGPGTAGGRNFLEGFPPALADEDAPGAWRGGLLPEAPGAWAVYEARGGYFRVRLRAREEDSLANPDPREHAPEKQRIPRVAAVWTAGKDRDWDTWEDNETSWGGGWDGPLLLVRLSRRGRGVGKRPAEQARIVRVFMWSGARRFVIRSPWRKTLRTPLKRKSPS